MAKQGLEADVWLEDSALFLSERHPDKALRRWFKDHLPRMRQTVEFLNELGAVVRGHPALDAVVAVAQIHEVGSDWALVDHDGSPAPVAECAAGPLLSEARQRCSEYLRALSAGGTGGLCLQMLDAMVRGNSASLHWSAARRKLLVVGAG